MNQKTRQQVCKEILSFLKDNADKGKNKDGYKTEDILNIEIIHPLLVAYLKLHL